MLHSRDTGRAVEVKDDAIGIRGHLAAATIASIAEVCAAALADENGPDQTTPN